MKRLIRGRVNIGQPSYTPLAYVNQLDDITLELDVYNGNSPLDVTGQTVSLYAKRSNTTVVEQLSGLSTASTKVTGDVKNSCFAVPGITEMQLEFTDSTGKTTVSSFYINVNKSLSSEDSITAGNEIAILTEAKKMEPIRQENERGRVEAEKLRVQSETDRAAAETARVEAEELRVTAEAGREKRLSDVEEKATNNATQIADIVKYQANSNKDYECKEHENLNERLIADYTMMMDRFNKARLLPYESEFISASNTYEGKTRDNVIKGRTLQNLWDNKSIFNTRPDTEGFITGIANGNYVDLSTKNVRMFKPSTLYTIITIVESNTLNGKFNPFIGHLTAISADVLNPIEPSGKGVFIGTITTVSDLTNKISGIRSFIVNDCTEGSIKYKIIALEGDYTNKPIPPYFEGIKSVNEDGETLEEVSCGKNLFDDTIPMTSVSNGVTYEKIENGFKITSGTESASYSSVSRRIPNARFLGKRVTFSCDLTQTSKEATVQIVYYNITGKAMYYDFGKDKVTVDFPYIMGKDYLLFRMFANNTVNPNIPNTVKITNIQMEYGDIKTEYSSYQEHQQTIKMKNLRSVGNVCDTSDGVRRVGKVVLDGSSDEDWMTSAYVDGYKTFVISSVTDRKPNTTVICDTFKTLNSIALQDEYIFGAGGIYVSILPSKLNGTGNVNDFRAWLQANPTTVYYELTEPIKEEGNKEELRTYDGITNIFTEGSLIEPTISCKVPSNVQAVVMNLREENQTLNNDVNTLQATTEENNLMNIETNVNQEARLTMLELGVI